MFGYVNVFQNELKIKEYNVYKAYYCGVCHSCGKNLSFFSRFTLSYDITFMAILLDSISDEKTVCVPKRCMVHPLKKRAVAIENKAVDFAACVGIMLTYLKFKDDVSDDKSLKGLLGMALLHRGVKKARKKFSGIYEEIEKTPIDEKRRKYFKTKPYQLRRGKEVNNGENRYIHKKQD